MESKQLTDYAPEEQAELETIFKRCMDLLDMVPEFANRMQEMKEVSEQWAAVVDHWDELVELYHDECDTGTCQKLYDRIKELGC